MERGRRRSARLAAGPAGGLHLDAQRGRDHPDADSRGPGWTGRCRTSRGHFFDLRLTGGSARQDSLRWPRRLYSKLTSLFGYIAQSDFPPTDQQLEVFGLYREQLAEHRKTLQDLREGEIADFNAALRQAGFGGLITGITD